MQSTLRVIGEVSITEKRTGRDAVAVLIGDIFPEEDRHNEVEHSGDYENEGKVCIESLKMDGSVKTEYGRVNR